MSRVGFVVILKRVLLSPNTLDELNAAIASSLRDKQPIPDLDLSAFSSILEHHPEDLTVTVQAGITLAALQAELAGKGQWLPLDPPNPATNSVSRILQENLSGPRRYGYGTIREHLIGLKVLLADGRIVKSGGKVVKNVAGYDLQKLFVGSRGSLGIILEAVFKLRPLPEAEQFWQGTFSELEPAFALVRKIIDSPLEPVVLDLYSFSNNQFIVVLGLAGTRQEVDWQNETLVGIAPMVSSTLKHEQDFWQSAEPVQKLSVLPTKLAEAIKNARPEQFVARAGNGVIYCRGAMILPKAPPAAHLMRRIKQTFDPHHILPELAI